MCLIVTPHPYFTVPEPLSQLTFMCMHRMFLMASGVAKMEISPLRRGEANRLETDRTSEGDSGSSDEDLQMGKELILLTLGDYFGENCLLGETDYGATFPGFSVMITAVTNVMCLVLTRENFQEVLSSYPFGLQEDVRVMAEEYHAGKKNKKTIEKTKHAHIVWLWGKICAKLKRKTSSPVGLADRFGKRLVRQMHAPSALMLESGESGMMSSEEDASSPGYTRRNGEKAARRRAEGPATAGKHDHHQHQCDTSLQHHLQLNLKLEDLGAQIRGLARIVADALPPQQYPSASESANSNRTYDVQQSQQRPLLPVPRLHYSGTTRVNGASQDAGQRNTVGDEPEPEIVYLSAA